MSAAAIDLEAEDTLPDPEPAEGRWPAARELARIVVARVLADLGAVPVPDTMETTVVNDNQT